MNDKITLMDTIITDTGVVGTVSEFDEVNGRKFVGFWATDRNGAPQKAWATLNAVRRYEN